MALGRRIPGGRGGKSIRTAFVLLAWFSVAAGAKAEVTFKLYVEEPGVYRVSFEDLAAVGFEGQGLPSDRLALSRASRPVPIWVEDGGDGLLGPGDRIEFLGERLRGEASYLDEHTRYNVYFLRTDAVEAARMTPGRAPSAGAGGRSLRSRRHLEEDLLILRLPPARDGEAEELWYWAKLVHNQSEPFVQRLDLEDLATGTGRTVDLKIAFRGWSRPVSKPPGSADHRVEISLNGVEVASPEWSGTAPHVIEIPALPADRFVEGANELELKVPRRTSGEDGESLIDVIMLNWIEIDYPHRAWVGGEQVRFELTAAEPEPVRLEGEPGRALTAYGAGGWRTAISEHGGEVFFDVPPGETSFVVTDPAFLRSPDLIVRDRPSRLVDPGNRADYVMIAPITA